MLKQNKLLILILALGAFAIINTEAGVIGILPSLAEHYSVSVSQAGLLVSLFALAVAISGVTMPLLFWGINQKKVMLLVLGIFILGNVVSIFTTNFTLALIVRVIPAFFHPIFMSMAFTLAAASVTKEEAPKAVSKIFIGISSASVIGLPTVSFIASKVSIEMVMVYLASVNALVFIAILLFVPSMPVQERLSNGTQLRVLKKSITWLSIVTVIFINAAVFGVYSYFAEYLQTVTKISVDTVPLLLVGYGVGGIMGNIVAGKSLATNAPKTVVAFPFALGAIYILLFFFGQFVIPMMIITLIWGMLAAIGAANINQYLIMSAAPEAPTFANGLFVTSANIGTTIGAAAGGLFISQLGTQYVVLVGLLSLILALIFILLRDYMSILVSIKQLSR